MSGRRNRRSASVEPPAGKRSLIPQPLFGRRRSGSMDNVNRKSFLPQLPARGSVVPHLGQRQMASTQRAPRPTNFGFTTPSRSTTKPVQSRMTMSSVRSSAGVGHGAQQAKPTDDPAYVLNAYDRIEHCLRDAYGTYDLPKEFKTVPGRTQFNHVFIDLARLIDPEFAPEGIRLTEDLIINFMKVLGYTTNVQKSSLVSIQKRSWPNVLTMLDYMVNLVQMDELLHANAECIAFPTIGVKENDDEMMRQQMILQEIMLPEYFAFTANAIPEQEEEAMTRIRARTALENFHNIDSVDPGELETEVHEKERVAEKLKSTNATLNAEFQACAGKITEEHDAQGQLAEKIESVNLLIKETQQFIADSEARAQELEVRLKEVEAENQNLTAKVANQPLSHSAAKKLRAQLKSLRAQHRQELAGIDSAKKVIEEKSQELAPLREQFDSICNAFQGEVVRHFGSKGLADFGATGNILTDLNISEWFLTVGTKLNATAKAKSAEMESSNKSISKLDQEIANLEKREAELKEDHDSNKVKAEAQKRSFESEEIEWTKKLEEAENAYEVMMKRVNDIMSKVEALETSLEAEDERLQKLMVVAEEGRNAVKVDEEEVAALREGTIAQITGVRQDLHEMIAKLWNEFEAEMNRRMDEHDKRDAAMFARVRKDLDEFSCQANEYLKKLDALVADVTSK